MRYKRTAAPAAEPVTLAEAFNHLRLDGYGDSPPHPDVALVEGLVTAAREWAEDYTGRVYAEGDFQATYPAFCSHMPLPVAPVSEVLEVTYLDQNGDAQVLDPALYRVDLDPDSPFIYRAYGASWPATFCDPSAVSVRFTAGYDMPGNSPEDFPVPSRAKVAMLLLVGHLYENREDSIVGTIATPLPKGAEYLLHPQRRAIL